jgi:regulator of replication initiation timing
MDINKDKIRKAEQRKLSKIAKNVPEIKKGVADSLIKELSFMAVTLEELRENVGEHGAVEWFVNGSQEMWRESPALKSYSTLIQRYGNLYKQLCDLLPKEEQQKARDEFLEFCGGGCE